MDMDKVIYDIERCVCHVPDACRDCSHYQDDPLDCMKNLLADALELIKSSRLIHTEHALYTVYEGHNGEQNV